MVLQRRVLPARTTLSPAAIPALGSRRARHHRGHDDAGVQRGARIVAAWLLNLDSDPRLAEPPVCNQIVGHALDAG